MRMCVACREMHPKNQMLRVVLMPDGTYEIDQSGRLNGRGAYVCNSEECINKCVKSRLLNRSFKKNVDQNIYEKVKETGLGAKRDQT